MYKTFILIALFLIYSFIGWIVEVSAFLIQDHKFVNRGFLIGPVVPIYGTGGILITILLTKYQSDPIVLFCMAVIVCSILEYLTSYIMEKIFKTRWWDYSNKKFNINGRICLSNLIVFGIMGLVMVYLINPFLINILNKIDPILLKCVVSILIVLFVIDFFVSFSVTSKIKNVGKVVFKDSTEEINAKVKEILLSKGKLTRRVIKAFPNFDIRLNKRKTRFVSSSPLKEPKGSIFVYFKGFEAH